MWEIVTPDDPDQDNGTKLLNYCIDIGPGQSQSNTRAIGDSPCNLESRSSDENDIWFCDSHFPKFYTTPTRRI
ncbi:hypothetical protein TNCV_4984651 [Trichonephila clavipes]|nr:hypothetical protein TNCV_4984651 [Trichonephila clavipes]